MAVRQFDAMAEITGAFQLLLKNWMLAIPTAAVWLITSLFIFFIFAGAIGTMGFGMTGDTNGFLGMLGAFFGLAGLFAIVIGLLHVLADATVVASAEEAWSGGSLDLSRSFSQALSCLVNLVIAFVIVGIAAGVLAITVVGPLAVLFFAMYVLPAIVNGKRSAIEAIGDSIKIAIKNPMPTVAALLTFFVAGVVAGILQGALGWIMGLNFIVATVVNGFLFGFCALVIARFYDLLKGSIAA